MAVLNRIRDAAVSRDVRTLLPADDEAVVAVVRAAIFPDVR